ncbi:MAG: tetratricopeptide repeat protein [Shinella sp.]|uniref:tetratricopeptide repeat protein n=1 Tax=Shinella sp. TaxID=1870904 RepID=UPI0040372D6C
MHESIAPPKFRLSLLGRFSLTTGDGIVHLPSRKLSGLLAYLACTGPQPQPRERLANLFWGSHYETQARQNLRQALFRLRRILGQDALLNNDDEVWLAAGAIDCDVAHYRALIIEGSSTSLAAAVDLYAGPLLSDLTIAEDAWSDWLAAERERLESLALDAMVGHGQKAAQAGDVEAALKAAQRAIQVNALREDAHRLIMRALGSMGRKAEALRHYQNLVGLLKRELNTEPDAVTQSLAAELRSEQPPGLRTISEPEFTPSAASGREVETRITAARNADTSTIVAASPDALEQRQLTILVCSPIAPMGLSANPDPGDAHDLITAFHKTVSDVATQFGGFVAQFQGNGVVVYFGYPATCEHDAERAVRAGLAMLASSGGANGLSTEALPASVGIATGLVVVGKKATADNGSHLVAIGEAPTLATRLQSKAASTQLLVGPLFDCRALPASDGKQQPHAWQVLGEIAGVSRFDARRGDVLSPLVGRQEEIALLLRRWDQASSHEGRVVLISGEAGIGKSRIAESVAARLDGAPHTRRRYSCSPHHTHSPLHPFIVQLQQDAGFGPDDSAGTRLDRLAALLAPTSVDLPRDVALFAELTGVALDSRYPALAASPQQKRDMTLGLLMDQLASAASKMPLLILFEDLHWIDPTSLDLLERLVIRAARLPLLLLATGRPEFQPGWIDQPHVTALSLSRLGSNESTGLIRGIARDKALPDAVIGQILAHTDGVPLFIEELTRSLLESGVLRETGDGWTVDGPLPTLSIPTTLQAALAARLDLLGPARDVAVIGATIGREFSHALITAVVSAVGPADIEAQLTRLVESGLISRRGAPPAPVYVFKHALVQDAAYVTMLKSRRRELHATIAGTLIDQFPALAEEQPEVVAQHFTKAGLASDAVRYWVKGARLAQARWANREAAGFFEQALRVLATLPETRETLEQAIDLRFDLKTSLTPIGQFDRIVSHLREAEDLARRLGDQRRLARCFFHMCQTLGLSGDPKEATAFGQQALELADALGDVQLQVAATLFLGTASFSTLDHRQVEPLFLRALNLLDAQPSFERFGLTGFPAVTVRAFLARIYAEQGKFELGLVHGEESIRIAHAVDDPFSLTIAYWCLADLLVIRGEFAGAITKLERAQALARTFDLPFMLAGSSGTLGYAHARLGQTAQGLPLLEQALGALEAMGHRFGQALFLVPLGEAHLLAGQHADASKYAGRALTMARESGQRRGEAGALRLLGDVLVRTAPVHEAEAHYRDALAIAQELDLGSLVARCHHDLGNLYRRTGQPDQARDQFNAATTMYREMGMQFWLEQAETESRQSP